MRLNVEGVVDRGVGGEVGVLGAVVLAHSARPVAAGHPGIAQRGAVGCQLVGGDRLSTDAAVAKQLAQGLRRSLPVAVLLNEHVEHLALVIDGTPQVYPLATDPNDHLVPVPPNRRQRPTPTQV